MDARDLFLGAWAALRCFVGLHYKSVGLIEWQAPYKPGSDVLHYTHYMGCPRCRRRAR